jgi:hypothetical protein
MSLYDGIPLDDLSTSSVMTSIDDNNSGGSDAKRAKKTVPTTTADNNSIVPFDRMSIILNQLL